MHALIGRLSNANDIKTKSGTMLPSFIPNANSINALAQNASRTQSFFSFCFQICREIRSVAPSFYTKHKTLYVSILWL